MQGLVVYMERQSRTIVVLVIQPSLVWYPPGLLYTSLYRTLAFRVKEIGHRNQNINS